MRLAPVLDLVDIGLADEELEDFWVGRVVEDPFLLRLEPESELTSGLVVCHVFGANQAGNVGWVASAHDPCRKQTIVGRVKVDPFYADLAIMSLVHLFYGDGGLRQELDNDGFIAVGGEAKTDVRRPSVNQRCPLLFELKQRAMSVQVLLPLRHVT